MRVLISRTAFLLAGIFLFSCSGQEPTESIETTTLEDKYIAHDIIYDVEVINPNPEDQWMNEALMGLDHDALLDFVFEGIYSDRFRVFDIFEGTPMTSQKISRMEKQGDFTRKQIGKFQFMEEWIIDRDQMTFSKKVTEIRMGLQKFDQEGYLTGYAPLFRVVL